MKWNATSVAAACIALGIGGFLVGKINSGSEADSETARLIAKSRRAAFENGGGAAMGDPSASRAARPARNSSTPEGTFEDRLGNMEEIVRGENALDRGRALLAWIDSLAPSEFEGAVDRFRSLGLTEARMGEYAMLLTAWAELDPTAALDYTTEKTRGGIATSTVMTAWASRDPESAIAWARANHEGDGANAFMAGIIRGLVVTNPARATELLESLPYSSERGDALQAMMPHLLKLGPESARQWIAGLKDEKLKDGAIRRFAEDMASDDPVGTADWLLANLGENSTHSVDEVFTALTKVDKNLAMKKFQSLPPGDARSRALRGIITVESYQNPKAAVALMDGNPGDIDDRMVQQYIWHSFDKEPALAMAQVSKMENEGSRNRMYERALGAWLKDDPASARAWIAQSPVPPSVVEKLKIQP